MTMMLMMEAFAKLVKEYSARSKYLILPFEGKSIGSDFGCFVMVLDG